MKTLVVNGRFLTQPVTGVQRYARGLLGALAARPPSGIRLVVAVPAQPPPFSVPPVEVMRDASSLSGHAWEQLRLPFLFRRAGGHLLWSPCNSGPISVRRQAVTLHDAAVFAGPQWFSPAFGAGSRALHRALGRVCRLVLTVSRFSAQELSGRGVVRGDKIHVVPNGVPPFPHPPPPSPERGAYLLAVGSRDPRKNVAGLLRGWSLLPEELRAGRSLLVAGGGAASFSTEALGAVPPGVRFLGRVDDGLLPGLYAGAEALVAPSFYEGFGLPPLEAMAAGTPVIASDIPPHREVCGDAVDYFDPADSDGLAEALMGFFYNPERRGEMAERGRHRAALFTWEAAAEALVRALEEAW